MVVSNNPPMVLADNKKYHESNFISGKDRFKNHDHNSKRILVSQKKHKKHSCLLAKTATLISLNILVRTVFTN